MSIDVRTLDDPDRWNDLLDDAAHPTPFHLAGALDVIAEYANAECHRLVGYKGQEPVGLFPVFTIAKGPVTTAFSPPPDLKVPYLGPTLVTRQQLKRRKHDRRHRRFVDACLDWLEDTHEPKFTSIRTPPGYEDVRPFIWQDYEPTPRYTYVVDLTRDSDDLLAAFSSDARGNVTGDYDADFTIESGGVETIENVVDQVSARHEEQGEPFPASAAYVTDLYETMPSGTIRPYACHVDGEYVGGFVNVEFGSVAFRWVGGAKSDADIPVNDLLDWEYCLEAMERGVEAYDLTGANDARLARYKSKFAPDLVTYYQLQEGTRTMNAVSKIYSKLK